MAKIARLRLKGTDGEARDALTDELPTPGPTGEAHDER